MRASVERHFYLLCILPDLGDFGSVPPVSKPELLAMVTESEGSVDIVKAMLLGDDLLQREAILAGEKEPEPENLAVFSLQQAKNEEPLPYSLGPEEGSAGEYSDNPITVDLIWQNYFQYAFDLARSSCSAFLQAWVKFEVGLRNSLARARAEALDLDPEPYLVAQELGDPEFSFQGILADWRATSSPLEELEALDRLRWNWATEREGWYSFNNDEVAAYTAKIMILYRWQRITAGNKK